MYLKIVWLKFLCHIHRNSKKTMEWNEYNISFDEFDKFLLNPCFFLLIGAKYRALNALCTFLLL